jgi:hypothetical protein
MNPKNWRLECHLYVCNIRTRVSQDPERQGALYSYSVFKTLTVTSRCPVNNTAYLLKARIVEPEETSITGEHHGSNGKISDFILTSLK